MVIGTSNVSMAAQSSKKVSYTENKEVLMRNLATGEKQYSKSSFTHTYEEAASEKNEFGKSDKTGKANGYMPKSYMPTSLSKEDVQRSIMEQLRTFMQNLRNKLYSMLGRNSYFGSYGNTLNLTSAMSGGYSLWRRTEYSSYTYEEQEEMTFSTKGKAVTADGRELSFNMKLSMSHEFVKETESLENGVVAIMTDPLVINLTDNPVSVSDQKWMFDIDADGTKDSISMLSNGSGYLVYDKNKDGVINDGSEMFGSKTGNGFAELAMYDEDGNGWIDENDSIYKQLSVWVKDSAGHDKLMSLKEADVGAIYLGSASSEFSLKSAKNNEQNAQVRRTGMYLTEAAGTARSIQQLDMVKAVAALTA